MSENGRKHFFGMFSFVGVTFPLLLYIIPTVIIFHFFKLDQTAVPWEECVMGYVHTKSLSGANGRSRCSWPIKEYYSLRVLALVLLATQQHSFR